MTDLLPSAPTVREDPHPPGTAERVVLDTSVLIADPGCLSHFGTAAVVIPLTVVEELDGLKTRPDDVGRAARSALRAIEELRVAHGGSLAAPMMRLSATLGSSPCSIRRCFWMPLISICTVPSPWGTGAALRIKAAHLGVGAAPHEPTPGLRDDLRVGWAVIETSYESIDCLYAGGRVTVDAIDGAEATCQNEFAVLRAGSQSALTRRTGDDLVLLSQTLPEPWGLRPRNKEQRFALELLGDPDVAVVALDGRAGTGKTILAIAASLEQVAEQQRYERVAIYRPLVPVGRADVGFLPGDLEEKLDPWMAAIHDAVVALSERGSSSDARQLIDELTARGQLTLESVTFLRGRSLQHQIVVIDEAQNLEPTTLRTILTRIGDGTKVIFTGDTSQIDAPYLGETNNALAVLTAAFADQSCFGHITLTACERSDVASLAAELL